MGESLSFFGSVTEAGFHDTALRMVADGRADGAAIDSHVLARTLAAEPDLARRVRVVAILGPSTIQPFAAQRALEAATRARLRAALVAATGPVLHDAGVRGFVAVDDSDYDDIRSSRAGASS
jgi:ABC-type phosphate/phosphonate transport system substrate-binding protein